MMDMRKFLIRKNNEAMEIQKKRGGKAHGLPHPFEYELNMNVCNSSGSLISVLPMSFLKSTILKSLMKGEKLKHLHLIDAASGRLKKISLNPTDTITVILPEDTQLSLMHYVINKEADKLDEEFEEFLPIEVHDVESPEDPNVRYKVYDIFFGDFINALINILYHTVDSIGFEAICAVGNIIVSKTDDKDDSYHLKFWESQQDLLIQDPHLYPITDKDGKVYYLDINL